MIQYGLNNWHVTIICVKINKKDEKRYFSIQKNVCNMLLIALMAEVRECASHRLNVGTVLATYATFLFLNLGDLDQCK